jgi:hypothetical protein
MDLFRGWWFAEQSPPHQVREHPLGYAVHDDEDS